jgi:TonB family protein
MVYSPTNPIKTLIFWKHLQNNNGDTMNKYIIIATALALFTFAATTPAYAMTNHQAGDLFYKAQTGDQTALSSLVSAAQGGDANAESWLEKLSAQNHANWEFGMGNAYYYGHGVPQNYAKAIYWYKKSAKQGYARAEGILGDAYYNGHGVPQNYAEAIYWYKKSAKQGYAREECNLGNAYYYGHGVPQNYAKADYWFEKAANRGYAGAEFNLGNDYANGQGVPQSYAKANYWYEKAAKQGSAGAEFNLNIDYYKGEGVPQNSMTALHWLKKVAAQGYQPAKRAVLFIENGSTGRAIPLQQKMEARAKLQAEDMAAVARARQAAENPRQAAENQRLSAIFSNEIGERVKRHWEPFFAPNLHCLVRIELSPQGQLEGQPTLTRSSGNAQFDLAVIAAIEAAAPFPPPIGLSYSQFKVVNIVFSAKELSNG